MLNPWNDDATLIKAKPVPLYSAREKMPFEVTPFMPYLTRYQTPASGSVPADANKADAASRPQQQPPQQQQQPPQQQRH